MFAGVLVAALLVAPQITFANVPWADGRGDVRGRLEAAGFTLFASTPDDFYRGTVDGTPATVTCVFTPDDELVFVRVIFDRGADETAVATQVRRAYGAPANCSAPGTQCRWERGDSAVTYAAHGDPYAPDDQATLEYTAGGSLAEKYVVQTQHTDRDNDRGIHF
jgi:hypothetical protein